jgi:hypothetical protein
VGITHRQDATDIQGACTYQAHQQYDRSVETAFVGGANAEMSIAVTISIAHDFEVALELPIP